jgi:glycosyltransferase involved in cell wall biosynthesis
MFAATVALLREFGHQVVVFEKQNREISGLSSRMRAATTGVYSLTVKRDIAAILKALAPDIVHVHNVYPLLSPSPLDACESSRIPVVMRLADFTLLCPTSHHFRRGAVCELCLGGKEYQCVLTNCRENVLMSLAYAVRTAVARIRRCFIEKVTLFVAPTRFVRDRFVSAGFPPEKILVIPNMVSIPERTASPSKGEYVAYVGRISPEKGLDVLLKAAEQVKLPIRIAGDISSLPDLRERAPANVQFVGKLTREQLAAFFRSARFAVVPSLCFETFNLSCAEAMAHGVPVLASRIGGLPEVVDDLENGLLFEAGNVEALAENMSRLWDDTQTIARLGAAARRKAVEEFSPATYYNRLLASYQAAIRISVENRRD